MAADIIKHPPISFLTGSSVPTGAPPAFEPIGSESPSAAPDIADATAAAAGNDTDPIFAAIEKHKAAWAAYTAAVDPCAEIAGRVPPHLEAARETASDAEEAARYDMHETVPQTVAGLAAYVAYWNSHMAPSSEGGTDAMDSIGWEAIPTIAEAIDNLFSSPATGPNRTEDFGEPAMPDRRALEAYATWLHYERRMVLVELYGETDGRAMMKVVHEDNPGGDMHFPLGQSWRNVPKPSTRAAAWLDLVGVEWRTGGIDKSGWTRRGLDIVGKVA